MIRVHSVFLCVCLCISVNGTGCFSSNSSDQKNTSEKPAVGVVKKEVKTLEKTTSQTKEDSSKIKPSSGQIKVGKTFHIIYSNAPIKSGQKDLIRIVPKTGYKVNTEYPNRLILSPPKSMKTSQNTVMGSIENKELKYQFDLLSASGTHTMAASADFSICNESMCELYRDEKLNWTVTIQ